MSFEIQVLEAFQTWRDAALQRHPLEALPTGEELVAAARDHTELEPGGEFPALLVWADALKKVRALALTDNTDVIPVSEDLYEPNLDPFPGRAAAPETTEPEQAEEYLEPEEEYAETVVDDLWASVATPTPTPVQEDYLDEESHPAEATAEEPELAETWDLTQFEEPARDRDTSPETDPDERHYQPHEFRMLDGFADVEPIPGANLWLEETAAGAIALNWSLPEESYSFGAATRLFRVVSDEVEFELDPELGEPRAVTVGTRWVDTADLTTAYRMYQVWVHEGSSETDALRGEPRLVGERWFIRPIESIELSVAGSVVKGQWKPEKHTHRVAVFAAQTTERRTQSRRNEIATDTQNLQGFRYTPKFKGVDYKFVAQRYVLIKGQQVASAPSTEFLVGVPAEVVEVPIDVDDVSDGFETRFNVSWEKPSSGEVRIYRTKEAPVDGLSDQVVEVDQLESFGLAQRDWTNDLERGLTTCRVDWPEDWYSVFLTPVSVVGKQAKVGRSHSRVRVGDITNATLHERVNNQLLTFGWPEEAHEVTAVFGTHGTGNYITPESPAGGTNIASIHEQGYKEEGGMRVTLPAAGDVALFPSRVYDGRQIWGDPVVLHYDGVRRYWYEFRAAQDRIILVIFSEREEHEHRSFTLRQQVGRLPLEPGDGLEVKTRRIVENGVAEADYLPGVNAGHLYPRETVTEYWEVSPEVFHAPQGSFLRLFARADHEPGTPVAALIDPNPATLRVDEWRRYFSGHQG